MEIFDNDKTRKAYYVFPYITNIPKAIEEVARTKHINPNKLEIVTGAVKGDELFLEPGHGGKMVTVIYKRTKTDGEGNS